jgi:hypothetical protein
MSSILKCIKNHWLAILLAVIIGFLVMLPTLRSIYNLGFNNFKGVYPLLVDDEEHYLARTKDIIDGHPGLGNAYLAEHKNEPYIAPPLAEWSLAHVAIIFHLPVATLFFYLDFILPFLGFILFYWLLYSITKQKRIAAILVFLFFILFLREVNRPIIQQLVFLPFFFGLWAAWRSFITIDKKSYFYSFLVSVSFGILLYISPYFWTTLVVLYFLTLGIKFLSQRDIKFIFKSGVVFIFGALLFSWPYLINLLRLTASIYFSETSMRMGMLNTHWPACFFNVGFALSVFILLFGFRKTIAKEKFAFALACLVTVIIVNWQNVITGKYLLFSSHYFPPIIILIFVCFTIMLASVCERNKRLLFPNKNLDKIVVVCLFLLIVLITSRQFGGTKFALTASASKDRMIELQKLSGVFDWFNLNTPKDSVIYFIGDDSYLNSSFYPIYTHNNIYSGGYDGSFLLSNEELLDREIRNNIFNENFNEQFIKENRFGPLVLYYISKYQNAQIRNKIISILTNKNIKTDEMYPPDYIDGEINRYNEVKKEDVRTALKKFQLDYIVLDTKKDDSGVMAEKLKKYNFIAISVKIGDTIVYQVK